MSTILWIVGLIIAGAIVYSLLSRETLFTDGDPVEQPGPKEEYANEIRPEQNLDMLADQEFYNDMALITGNGKDMELLEDAEEADQLIDGEEEDFDQLNGLSEEEDEDDLPMGSKTWMKDRDNDQK